MLKVVEETAESFYSAAVAAGAGPGRLARSAAWMQREREVERRMTAHARSKVAAAHRAASDALMQRTVVEAQLAEIVALGEAAFDAGARGVGDLQRAHFLLAPSRTQPLVNALMAHVRAEGRLLLDADFGGRESRGGRKPYVLWVRSAVGLQEVKRRLVDEAFGGDVMFRRALDAELAALVNGQPRLAEYVACVQFCTAAVLTPVLTVFFVLFCVDMALLLCRVCCVIPPQLASSDTQSPVPGQVRGPFLPARCGCVRRGCGGPGAGAGVSVRHGAGQGRLPALLLGGFVTPDAHAPRDGGGG